MFPFLISVCVAAISVLNAQVNHSPARGVVQVLLRNDSVYTWTLKDPATEDESLTTYSLITRSPVGVKGDTVFQSVESFLFDQGHHFPLRWAVDGDTLWLGSFFIDQGSSAHIPWRCQAIRVPVRFVIGSGPKPKLDPIKDEGFVFDDSGLYISGSSRPTVTSIRRGFLAAYARDLKEDDLVKIAEVGKPPKDGRPPFTFDFSPPSASDRDWTLYVQRAPRKTVDLVTFRADKEGEKVRAKVESIPVPFAEPFFAHRDSTGRVFFVTEMTGRVFMAEPPAGDRKEWKVTAVWDDVKCPVLALVRNSRDGSACVGITKKGATGDGEDYLLPLSGKPALKRVELKRVPRPDVNRTEIAATWFGRAVATDPPAKRPK